MSNDKYLLSRNDLQIRINSGQIRDELTQMNRWLAWFNSLAYVQPITTLESAKEFLNNTKDYHESQVSTFLKLKSGGELPPNTEPLRLAWLISDCDNKDFSGCASWEHLVFADGKLSVPESVFEEIKARHEIRATTKAEKALIDRIYKFAAELEYFTPKQKDNILTESGVFDFTTKGLRINLKFFYSLLNK